MIAVFSGTGNSMYVARRLAAILGDEIVRLPVKGDTMPRAESGRVIWVFPVYSWGMPPLLAGIIDAIDIEGAEAAVHYAVMTCGDDTGYADCTWRRAVAGRGWMSRGIWSVQMPNTYVFMTGFDVDSVESASSKISAAGSRIEAIAAGISVGSDETDVVRGAFAWIKTYVIRPWFVKHCMSPDRFGATADCIGCGVCSDSCPLHNIEMKDRRPQWGHECAYCLRCYHICPRHAVAWGKASRGKGQSRQLIGYVFKCQKDV